MKREKSPLAQLLPRGAVKQIAEALGLSGPAVSIALRRGSPSHAAVREAVRMVEESGALATSQKLATLTSASAA